MFRIYIKIIVVVFSLIILLPTAIVLAQTTSFTFPPIEDISITISSFDVVLNTDDCEDGDDPEWCTYKEQVNLYEQTFHSGDTIALDLNKESYFEFYGELPPEAHCNFVGYHSGEDIYYIDSSTGERQVVAKDEDEDSDFYGNYYIQNPGAYEIDVYFDCYNAILSQSFLDKLLAAISTKKAFAQSFEGTTFVATANFTVVDANAESVCTEDCYSNVLFIPGIMSSRLYDEDGNKLWEPEVEGGVKELYLDTDGKSVNDVKVGEVVDTFNGPLLLSFDIYKSFLSDLASATSSGLINDYYAFPYDWRLSMNDILADDSLTNKLRELVSSSKSGKVTIVAHSNGGLVTKALLNSLGDEAGDLVDKIVLVAVPQLGTPQAVGALLHGFKSGIPTKYSDALARDFSQNSPMAYQLLPLGDYRNNVGYRISTPLVSFEDGVSTQPFIDKYGYAIVNGQELDGFLRGSEGRNQPTFDDLENPTVANSSLLSNAELLNGEIGASWVPPDGIEVHEIAGVGEQTLAGIKYKTIDTCVKTAWDENLHIDYCVELGSKLSYDPVLVLDGDGTVIEPSALAISTSSDSVHRWWVDLKGYNKILFGLADKPLLRTNHKDILSVNDLRDFIFDNLFFEHSSTTHQYVSSSIPLFESNNQLTFVLHSPLTLSAEDSNGDVISADESTIEDATYERYGEVQVLTIPTDIDFTLNLNGEKAGSFTLEVSEIRDGEVVATSTYSAIPSATSTVAKIAYSGTIVATSSVMTVDYDGNGEVDATYTATEGEVVQQPDDPYAYTTPAELLAVLYKKLDLFATDDVHYKMFLAQIKFYERAIKKNKRWSIFDWSDKRSDMLLKMGERILDQMNRWLENEHPEKHLEHEFEEEEGDEEDKDSRSSIQTRVKDIINKFKRW